MAGAGSMAATGVGVGVLKKRLPDYLFAIQDYFQTGRHHGDKQRAQIHSDQIGQFLKLLLLMKSKYLVTLWASFACHHDTRI